MEKEEKEEPTPDQKRRTCYMCGYINRPTEEERVAIALEDIKRYITRWEQNWDKHIDTRVLQAVVEILGKERP